ncbi:MAG: hypothetical protein ACRC2K_06310 [Clostridium sp.]
MDLIVMILLGSIALVMAFQIWFNENITLIPAVDEKIIKKIKKRNVIAREFGLGACYIAGACYATAGLSYFLGKPGLIVGMVFIIITALNWASLQKQVEHKIRNRKY